MVFGFYNYDLFLASGDFGFNTACSDIYGISAAGLSGSWQDVAGIFTNNSGITSNQLYINGVKQSVSQLSGTPCSIGASMAAHISGWPNTSGYLYDGYIDHLLIYNRALTSAQIQAIYNKEKS